MASILLATRTFTRGRTTIFELLSKLAEIFSKQLAGAGDWRRVKEDAKAVEHLCAIVWSIQLVYEKAEYLLNGIESALYPDVGGWSADKIRVELEEQRNRVEALRHELERSRTLFGCLDVELYFELFPLIDRKSGLLSRWIQQASGDQVSSTAVFFLPGAEIERTLALIRVDESSRRGLDGIEYLTAYSHALRRTRRAEIRSILDKDSLNRIRIIDEIKKARSVLADIRRSCVSIFATIEAKLGADALRKVRSRTIKKLT